MGIYSIKLLFKQVLEFFFNKYELQESKNEKEFLISCLSVPPT